MRTFEYTDVLNVLECCRCHMSFAIPGQLEDQLRRNHATFYCPSGHPQHFGGRSDVEKAKARAEAAEATERHLRDQLQASERSKAALKGVVTKTKKRAAKGMCPVPGCRRHFVNVAAHVAGQHPDFDPEHSA